MSEIRDGEEHESIAESPSIPIATLELSRAGDGRTEEGAPLLSATVATDDLRDDSDGASEDHGEPSQVEGGIDHVEVAARSLDVGVAPAPSADERDEPSPEAMQPVESGAGPLPSTHTPPPEEQVPAEPVTVGESPERNSDFAEMASDAATALDDFVGETARSEISEEPVEASLRSDESQPEAVIQIAGDSKVDLEMVAAGNGQAATAEASEEESEPSSDASEQPSAAVRARAPRRYKPVARTATMARPAAAARAPRRVTDHALRIELRLHFDPGGFCQFALMPRRDDALPARLEVLNEHGTTIVLEQLQDDWYQDVAIANLGPVLRTGLEWKSQDEGAGLARWSLSGRDVFVLAEHNHLSGFVSTPVLVLGEDHVVICVQERADDVRSAIAATKCPPPAELGEDLGVPAGWIGFRGVVPRVPVPPSAGGDILDALRPLPDIELVIDAGIRLEHSRWLAGFAPRIHLRGDASTAGEVLIDGHKAGTGEDGGGYVAEGWDEVGDHSVWCAGKSVTYSIVNGPEEWQAWEAHRWSLGEEAPRVLDRPAICGTLTLPPATRPRKRRSASGARRSVIVPASNPVLIGSSPEEYYCCAVRSDLGAKACSGFPDFDPVWAFPANALHSDKQTARVLCVGQLQGPDRNFLPSRSRRSYGAWVGVILTASRKGLQTYPAGDAVRHLWVEYRKVARALRRELR